MALKINTYKNYTVQDLVLDENFIAWCKNMPGGDNAFWNKVVETYPEQEKNIRDAKHFLLNARVKDHQPSAKQIQDIWLGIEQELQVSKPVARVRSLSWMRVAAAIFILVAGAAVIYVAFPVQNKVQTQYAEIKQLVLPDHSRVVLNSNSVIRYSNKWDESLPREVWLTGEAYFDVNHLHKGSSPVKPGERFIVHANGVDVEVLGTSFNIVNRHNAARIILTSGSIELKFTDKKRKDILMKPGEEINYSKASQKIEKQTANTSKASSWKEYRWEFENDSLKNVLQLLKDNYGLDARVENADLWNKTISGTISSDNTEIVIRGLSILLDTKIEQKNKTLLLK